MPLVVVCGQPCSGKSTVAAKLAEAFRALGWETHVVSEPSLHLERDAAYKGESEHMGKNQSHAVAVVCWQAKGCVFVCTTAEELFSSISKLGA